MFGVLNGPVLSRWAKPLLQNHFTRNLFKSQLKRTEFIRTIRTVRIKRCLVLYCAQFWQWLLSAVFMHSWPAVLIRSHRKSTTNWLKLSTDSRTRVNYPAQNWSKWIVQRVRLWPVPITLSMASGRSAMIKKTVWSNIHAIWTAIIKWMKSSAM